VSTQLQLNNNNNNNNNNNLANRSFGNVIKIKIIERDINPTKLHSRRTEGQITF
jgi:hypothetical protein